jgi:hypothetical protein
MPMPMRRFVKANNTASRDRCPPSSSFREPLVLAKMPASAWACPPAKHHQLALK